MVVILPPPFFVSKSEKEFGMYVKLKDIKNHLNIDSDFTDDDKYLLGLMETAQLTVQKHIDRNLNDLEDNDGDIPSPLKHAIMLLVGNFYANRESVAFSNSYEVPTSYSYLLALYRNFNGPSKGTDDFMKG